MVALAGLGDRGIREDQVAGAEVDSGLEPIHMWAFLGIIQK